MLRKKQIAGKKRHRQFDFEHSSKKQKCEDPFKEIKRSFDNAVNEEDFCTTINLIDKFLKSTPKNHPRRLDAKSILANAYRKTQQYQDAKNVYQEIIKNTDSTSGNHVGAQVGLARIEYEKTLNIENFINTLKPLEKINFKKACVLKAQGFAYLKLYKKTRQSQYLENAEKNYKKLLNSNAGHQKFKASLGLAEVYFNKYRYHSLSNAKNDEKLQLKLEEYLFLAKNFAEQEKNYGTKGNAQRKKLLAKITNAEKNEEDAQRYIKNIKNPKGHTFFRKGYNQLPPPPHFLPQLH